MDRLSSTVTAGKAVQRSRILNDDELRRVWVAAAETPYPYGGLVRMLIPDWLSPFARLPTCAGQKSTCTRS
jgi:hypothetical protein